MTRIIYVRHGETKWNKDMLYQGQRNTKLTKLGKEQAKKVAERLKNEKIDAIYTSKLSRAVDTAKEINKYHNKKIKQLPELNEISFGIIEGLHWTQVKKKYPKIYDERKRRKYTFKVPKGESYKEVEKRAIKKIKELIKKHPNDTIVISGHGTIKKLFLKYFLKRPLREVEKIHYKNAGITILDVKDGKTEVVLLNDDSHLS